AAREDGLSEGAADEFLGADPVPGPIDPDPMLASLPGCPVVLIHGALDDEVPAGYSRSLAGRDARVGLLELADADHYDLIDPLAPAFAVLTDALAGLPGTVTPEGTT
ncbi:MAG: hypothetical protein AB7I24_12620, partial [Candidatus Nanopelagicales bacterium]